MATYRGSHSNPNGQAYFGGAGGMSGARNDLFGGRGAAGGAPGSGGAGQSYAEQTRALYEDENNRQTAVLGEHVSRLKELSLQINGEVRGQNDLLDGMGGTFGQTGQLMSGTLKKLNVMISTGGSKHMCYLIAFVVAVFFALYFMLLRRG